MQKEIKSKRKYVWIFNSNIDFSLPSAAFKSKKKAIEWILKNKLSGLLSKYPLDISLYDWAIENKYFYPKNELQKNSKAIGNFNSAYLEHYHFEDGSPS